MNKTFTLLLFFLFTAFSIEAQDIHFSQFFYSPQTLNPAEIGNFDAQYRLNANQKTQWREVSRPYTSFAFMGDGRFDITPENVSLGLMVLNDNAGDSRFNTFRMLAGGAYRYQLKNSKDQFLQGGLQLGFTQIKLDREALSFNNQYNGVVYNPNLPSGESFPRTSRWYFNLNMGVNYTWQPETRKKVTLGLAGHNMTAPDQSFFNDTGVNLPLRLSIYAKGEWKIAEDLDLLPAIRYMDQATFSEFIAGTGLRYILLNERALYRSVFAGYFGRFGDSGIAMAGVEIDEWRIAASYDINVSNLKPASRNRGGFEFSVRYLFNSNKRNTGYRHKYCPVFL